MRTVGSASSPGLAYATMLAEGPLMESRPARQSVSRHNMPARLTSFVGRERELAGLARLLKSHRLVTLTGTGGWGKTRLASEAASREVAAFPDGVFFISLAALADTSLVISAI